MTGEQVFQSEEFQKCVAFHGHFCPGLSIGFRAARAGLEWLAENRSEDEQVAAVVENDACGVDAVQALTGCTFGKGNLIFRDLGKQAFTFYSRGSGRAVRISLKPGALDPVSPAGRVEPQPPQSMRHDKGIRILGMPLEDLFTVTEVAEPAPPKARIHNSVICAECGEPTMETRTRNKGGRALCLDCAARTD